MSVNMKKNSNLKTFWISLSLTLLLLIVVGLGILGLNYFNNESQANTSISNQPINFKPSVEQNINILLMGKNRSDSIPKSYILVNFNAINRKVLISSLPKQTVANLNIKTKTLEQFYEYGGPNEVCKAVSSLFDIQLSKYICLSTQTFNTFVNLIGGLEFEVQKPIQGTINIKKGIQTLDGFRITEIIKNTPISNLEQIKTQNTLIQTLINTHLNKKNFDILDILYQKTINLIDSNITHYDYIFRKDAFEYIACSQNPKCEVIEVSGSFNSINTNFNIDDISFKNIQNAFK